MSATIFLIINGLIVFYIVARIVGGGKLQQPTPLKPEGGRRPAKPGAPWRSKGPSSEIRNLNCRFSFEGDDYDAFEVLGVPAGSSREVCYGAYRNVKRADRGKVKLVESAWQALERYFLE